MKNKDWLLKLLTATLFTCICFVASPSAQGADQFSIKAKQVTFKVTVTYLSSNETTNEIGTGVFIGPDGDGLIAYHTVANWLRMPESEQLQHPLQIRTAGDSYNSDIRAIVEGGDQFLDIALIKVIRTTKTPFARICYSSAPKLGDSLDAYGFPGGHDIVPVTAKFANDTESSRFAISASIAFEPGFSGGPVFDKNGFLLGIVHGGDTGVVFVNPIAKARSLIDNNTSVKEDCSFNPKSIYRMPLGTFSGIVRGVDRYGKSDAHTIIFNLDSATKTKDVIVYKNGEFLYKLSVIGKFEGEVLSGQMIPADWVPFESKLPLVENMSDHECQSDQDYSVTADMYSRGYNYNYSKPIMCTDYEPDRVKVSVNAAGDLIWSQADSAGSHLEGVLVRE